MQKAELRKLRRLDATKEMMQKAKYKITVHDKYEKKDTEIYEYEAFIRIQNLGAYIKIAIFDPERMRANCTSARFEVFINTEGREYTTRELNEKGEEIRWSTAMIYNLLEKVGLKHYWWQYDNKQQIFINADAKKTLSRLSIQRNTVVGGLARLQQWQQEAKDAETKRREKEEQRPWDEDMAKIPSFPKNINTWARKNVLLEHYIFYKYTSKKTTKGWCTCCRHEVMITEPRYNKEGTCPRCRAKIRYKSTGKFKTLRAEGSTGYIIQKIDGGIVERSFTYHETYRKDLRHPEEFLYESTRRLLTDNEFKTYNWDLYKNKYTRWCLSKDSTAFSSSYYYSYFRNAKLYTGNLKKINSPLLKHSSYSLWQKELPVRLLGYISLERQYPVIEKLAKVGLFDIAEELIRERDKETLKKYSESSSLAAGLLIDKFRLKRLIAMNGNPTALKWFQLEKRNDEVIPDEIISNLSKEDIEINDIHFALKRLSLIKTYNYLSKQSKEMDESLSQTITTWKDYLNMAKRAKINIEANQLFKPKNLKLEHDKLVLDSLKGERKKLVKELEKEWPEVNSKMPKLKKFEFAADGYQIIAPNGIEDIVTEGLCLRHCVHNVDYYYDRIQRDESYIFFLRKAANPDFPWYTLEVEPSGNIRQKRTTGDKQNGDFQNAVAFLKKWQKYFAKQLTKEEKKLGIIADKLRKENYKQLRKDEKKVWHGKYAGQLLADILEADFMEAM